MEAVERMFPSFLEAPSQALLVEHRAKHGLHASCHISLTSSHFRSRDVTTVAQDEGGLGGIGYPDYEGQEGLSLWIGATTAVWT